MKADLHDQMHGHVICICLAISKTGAEKINQTKSIIQQTYTRIYRSARTKIKIDLNKTKHVYMT